MDNKPYLKTARQSYFAGYCIFARGTDAFRNHKCILKFQIALNDPLTASKVPTLACSGSVPPSLISSPPICNPSDA
uniref:BTB domain-containing protein n=1 Tax=Panagrellus redivivus TaxID=6233 RepID=A0A7E4V9J2_PANRE